MIAKFRKQLLIILGLFALMYPNISVAGWGAVGACITNICSCGCPSHTRNWGPVSNTDRLSCNCPPYAVLHGRSGCLEQYSLPHEFEINFLKFCAEDSGSQDFFNPDIRVRIQTCNLGCWGFSTRLEGSGECQTYPGPYGLPTVRICARATFPKLIEGQTPINTNPTAVSNAVASVASAVGVGALTRETNFGYTYGWHLDYEGYPRPDAIFTDDAGDEVILNFPKTCAYWDPSVWDSFAGVLGFFINGISTMVNDLERTASSAGISAAHIRKFEQAAGVTAQESSARSMLRVAQAYFQPDIFDVNPVYQPVHFAEGGTHFLFRMIIAMHRMRASLAQMRDQLVLMAAQSMDMPEFMIDAISGLLQFMAVGGVGGGPNPLMIQTLEYFGQLNNVVGGALGCADVPLGPYPPPYCPTLTTPQPTLAVAKICPTEMVGTVATLASPTSTNNCVKSSVVNNAVHNAVRVSFSDSVPICTSSLNPSTGVCVRIPISQSGATVNYATSATAMNTATSGTHTLRACSTAPPSAADMPCVESSLMLSRCSGGNRHCTRGIRILYTDAQASSSRQQYYSDIPDCSPTNSGASCQKIWGVDLGEYSDMALNFPATESSHSTAPLTATTNLVDPTNSTLAVTAKIHRTATTHSSGTSMNNSSIYVFDSANTLVGSVTRAAQPMPDVSRCDSPAPGARVTCSTSHVRPALVAKVAIGTSSTEGALSLDSTYPGTGGVTTETLNLAGYDYTTFATDATLVTSPFRGPRSLNARSIYGNYSGGAAPYTSTGTPTNASYLSGLEYINGEYVYGGTTLCLDDYEFERCVTGTSRINCVKTYMNNHNLINCTDFQTRVLSNATYSGITLCSSTQRSTYSNTANLSFTSPNMSVGIYNSGSQYCYDYSSSSTNGELCSTAKTRALRVDPASSITGTLSSSQYFNYNRSSPPTSPYVVRDKTPLEHGLCVPIPSMPSCGATSAAVASSNGNATWAAANIGTNSTGTCLPGYSPRATNALSRLCTRNDTNGNANFVPITNSIGCSINCSVRTNVPIRSYNPTTKVIALSQPGIAQGITIYRLQLDIPSVASVRQLRLFNVGVDDSYRVKINGNHIISGPSGVYHPGHEYGQTTHSGNINRDLRSHLRVGTNEIEFTVSVMGGGNFYANVIYERTGCNNFSIQSIP